MEQLGLRVGRGRGCVVVLACVSDLDLAAEGAPERGVVGILGHEDDGAARPPVVVKRVGDAEGLGDLVAVRARAVPLEDLKAHIKDEHVTGVQRGALASDLGAAHRAFALALKQAGREHVALDLGEAGLNAAWEVLDASLLEVRHEEIGLVALHLTVLNRPTTERVVKLAGLVRGDAGLVLGGLRAEPKVDAPVHGVRGLGLGGGEEYVRVARVELAVGLRLLDRRHGFDAPQLEARRLTGAHESFLGGHNVLSCGGGC
mmetsp:Transcript_9257/g.23197  ORF Transcript_9257/g.23197 Transcript_9257/m.23197 type:complete len:259 (-) Transcript_9257:12-788(-)